jgi:hypothetical protein
MKLLTSCLSLSLLGAALVTMPAAAANADPIDPRGHLQVAAGVGVGVGAALSSRDWRLDDGFTAEARWFRPSGHGWMVRGRFGTMIGLTALTVDGAWAYRGRIAGAATSPVQLLGGAFAGLGVTAGEEGYSSCGSCFPGAQNVTTHHPYGALGAVVGTGLDLRLGGWLIGASVEGRLVGAVGTPPGINSWIEGAVFLRTGVDLPL